MSRMDKTTAYTKGAKKRARKARKALDGCELAPIPRRTAQPRDREGRFHRPEEDPRRQALDSRCVRFGLEPSARNREVVKSPWMGCDMGFVIETRSYAQDEARPWASRLWDVFSRWSRAEATYRARYLGQLEQPAGAALQMVPERIETDPSATVDARTADERDRDAVNVWMRWQGFLGHMSADMQSRLHSARRGDGPLLWLDFKPTPAGLVALEALRHLADVSERP